MNRYDSKVFDELRKATRREHLTYLLAKAEHKRLMVVTDKLLALSEEEFDAFADAELQDLQEGMREQEREPLAC